MAKVFRMPDGSHTTIGPDGQPRTMTEDEVGNIVIPMSQVLNEQGVTWQERMTFKNVTESPEIARKMLTLKGYETRRLPKKAGEWNFAVRKSPKDPWKLVDPIGGLDIQDVSDLLSDITMGVAVSAGAATGGIGGAAAAGVAHEFIRQTLGQALGAPQDGDISQIAVAGVTGALSEVGAIGLRGLGKMIMKGGRGTTRVVNAITARINGVRNTPASSAEEINLARVDLGKMRGERIATYGRVEGPKEYAPDFIKTIDDIYHGQGQVSDLTFASRAIHIGKLIEGEQRGVKIDVQSLVDSTIARLRPVEEFKFIPGKGLGWVKTPAEVRGKAAEALQEVLAEISESAAGHQFSQTPALVADGILERLSHKFALAKMPQAAAKHVEGVLDDLEQSILRAFDDAGMPEYRSAHQLYNETLKRLNIVRARTLPGADEAIRLSETAKFLRDLNADHGAGYKRYLEQLQEDLNLGDKFTRMMQNIDISKGFGFRGEPQTVGQLAATGGPRGLAFGAALGGSVGGGVGLAGGGIAGIAPGAIVGALGGLALSLPRVALGVNAAAQGIRTGSAVVPRVLNHAAARAITPGALSPAAKEFASSVVVSQKSRKQVRIGQF